MRIDEDPTASTPSPVSIVFGASSGIGAAIAKLLCQKGHRVVGTGRNSDRLNKLQTECAGFEFTPRVGDATSDAHVNDVVSTAREVYGGVKNLVWSAGFSAQDSIATGDPRIWHDLMSVNVVGPMNAIRTALPDLVASSGRILLIGSVVGLKHSPGNTYSVSKWAVSALAENTRLYVTEQGVGVTLLAPGRVDTPFWDSRGGTPEGPCLTADDVARAACWALDQPPHVDVNIIALRPLGQIN